MSVAVGENGGIQTIVRREVIRRLEAWDPATQSPVMLEAGSIIGFHRIRRNSPVDIGDGAEAYDVEFESAGHLYICPLFRFQPRTEAVEVLVVAHGPGA